MAAVRLRMKLPDAEGQGACGDAAYTAYAANVSVSACVLIPSWCAESISETILIKHVHAPEPYRGAA